MTLALPTISACAEIAFADKRATRVADSLIRVSHATRRPKRQRHSGAADGAGYRNRLADDASQAVRRSEFSQTDHVPRHVESRGQPCGAVLHRVHADHAAHGHDHGNGIERRLACSQRLADRSVGPLRRSLQQQDDPGGLRADVHPGDLRVDVRDVSRSTPLHAAHVGCYPLGCYPRSDGSRHGRRDTCVGEHRLKISI